jgi:hypothetical protein
VKHTSGSVEHSGSSSTRVSIGYTHIPKKYASLINEFDRAHFNPYLFFHRQCAFADEIIDEKGKIKKVYKTYLTPCKKLLSIENVGQYLKEGITTESLKKSMMEKTHFAAAQEMQKAKQTLFATIRRKC